MRHSIARIDYLVNNGQGTDRHDGLHTLYVWNSFPYKIIFKDIG